MRLFVFDLDGTLVDSRRDLAESANELLERYGGSPLSLDQITQMVGDGARVLVERVLSAAAIDAAAPEALARFLEIYERRLVVHTTLYPGVREALELLGGRAPLAILTNKPGRHTHMLLEALGIRHYFAEVIGGDSVFPRKPDPTALRHLITMFGATPDTAVMVGDSMVDAETARGGPARLCLALYGFGRFTDVSVFGPNAVLVYQSQELPNVCRRLLERGDDGRPVGR